MKPIMSTYKARKLLRFSGTPKEFGTLFRIDEGPWLEVLAGGGKGRRAYYLSWVDPKYGKIEVFVRSLGDVVRLIALGPDQVAKTLQKGLQRTAKGLGLSSLYQAQGIW